MVRRKVSSINSSLKNQVDFSIAKKLKVNNGVSFVGVTRVGDGFLITEEQALGWITKDKKNKKVLKRLSSGTSLTDGPNGKTEEWIIDFNDMSLEEVSNYPLPLERIKLLVKPERDNNNEKKTRENWWKFARKGGAMRKAIAPLSKRYFAFSRHSEWFIPLPLPLEVLQENSGVAIASEDFYVLGLLTSSVHRLWVGVQSSTLGDITRYTHTTCFCTFPFPQSATEEQIKVVRQAMVDLHEYRSEQMEGKQWGITKLYDAFFQETESQLYRLHKKLDSVVMESYGFFESDDILGKLLTLNLELAEKEKNGDEVIGAVNYTLSK